MIIQIVCDTKEDFPEIGDTYFFDGRLFTVKKVKISVKTRFCYFVDLHIEYKPSIVPCLV